MPFEPVPAKGHAPPLGMAVLSRGVPSSADLLTSLAKPVSSRSTPSSAQLISSPHCIGGKRTDELPKRHGEIFEEEVLVRCVLLDPRSEFWVFDKRHLQAISVWKAFSDLSHIGWQHHQRSSRHRRLVSE